MLPAHSTGGRKRSTEVLTAGLLQYFALNVYIQLYTDVFPAASLSVQ